MPDDKGLGTRGRSRIIGIAKIILVVSCLVVVLNRLHIGELLAVWRGLHPGYLLLAGFVILSEPLIVATKWHLLIKHSGAGVSWPDVLKAIWIGNFLSLLFPTSLSADALRLALLGRRYGDLPHLTGTLVADRLAAVAGLIALSLVGLPFAVMQMGWNRALYGVLLLCIITISVMLLLLSPWTPQLLSRLNGWAQNHPSAGIWMQFVRRLTGLVERVYGPVAMLMKQPVLLAVIFGLGITVQLWRIFQLRMLFLSLGATHSFLYDIAFIPMIILLTLLPVSFLGLGIKEGAFVFFFTSIGIAVETSVGVSLLTYPLIVLALLPGGVLFL